MSDYNSNNYTPTEPVPTIDKPEFEVPPLPAQFQDSGYPPVDFQQPVNLTNGMSPKKSKKKLVAIISTLVGVAACACVAIFAGPKIIDALSNSSKGAPIDRLKSSFESLSKELSESDNNAQTTELKNFNAKLKVDLSLSDTIVSMLPAEIASLKETTLELDATNYEKQNYIKLDLSTPIAKALSLNCYLNSDDSNIYMQIPQLSDSFLSTGIDMTEMFSVNQSPQISGKELATLLDDEVNTFFDAAKDVEIDEDFSVKVNGISTKYDKITFSMNGTELGNTIYSCFERLTQESYIKEAFVAYSLSEGGVTLDEILSQAKTWANTNNTGFTFEFYLNDDDKIKGLIMYPDIDSSDAKISFMIATDDDDSAFEFYASEDDVKLFALDGTSNKAGNACSGNMKFTTYTNGIAGSAFEITFKDVIKEKESLKGNFTLAGSALSGLSISLDIDSKSTEGKVVLSVDMATMNMGTLAIDYSKTDVTSCPTLPTDAIVFDANTQTDDYLATADLMGFITDFYNATGIDLSSSLNSDISY